MDKCPHSTWYMTPCPLCEAQSNAAPQESQHAVKVQAKENGETGSHAPGSPAGAAPITDHEGRPLTYWGGMAAPDAGNLVEHLREAGRRSVLGQQRLYEQTLEWKAADTIAALQGYKEAWEKFVSLQTGDVQKLCDAAVENAALRQQVAELKDEANMDQCSWQNLLEEKKAAERECLEQCRLLAMSGEREARLMAERDALRDDAERYRWLRERHCDGDEQWFVYGSHNDEPNAFDAEFDSAMQAKEK